ncbi:hypothetical protein E2C01_017037 [Portunus trituberculatus]|uniref:Uncharacterized protein n=1 Tax=Portunus trituberculatus TaxID=210409 RepID=A0A5B7DRC9_PORTR|nr:hypothetical protein [Portunus trituberculatus]
MRVFVSTLAAVILLQDGQPRPSPSPYLTPTSTSPAPLPASIPASSPVCTSTCFPTTSLSLPRSPPSGLPPPDLPCVFSPPCGRILIKVSFLCCLW